MNGANGYEIWCNAFWDWVKWTEMPKLQISMDCFVKLPILNCRAVNWISNGNANTRFQHIKEENVWEHYQKKSCCFCVVVGAT